jgi:hypothetical protein
LQGVLTSQKVAEKIGDKCEKSAKIPKEKIKIVI